MKVQASNKEEFDKLVKVLFNSKCQENEDNILFKNYDDTTYENCCVDDTTPIPNEPMGEHIFNLAKRIINGHRQDDYGTPEDSFQNIANYWNAYLNQIGYNENKNITAKDVALMMVLFKIARLGHNYTRDSVIDICGYTAIYAAMHGD